MVDLIKIETAGARLSKAMAASEGSLDCLATITHSRVKAPKCRKVIVTFVVDGYAPLKLICHQMEDGHFWVSAVEVVLPAILHGHNGRLLRDEHQLFLALTIVEHLCRLVLEPGSTASVIPGVGAGNLGFIRHIEFTSQGHDPGQAFLRASQLGRLPHQQQPSRIYLSQSVKHAKRDLAISVYDKLAEIKHGFVVPSGSIATRVESQFKCPFRLARTVLATGTEIGAGGEVLATVTPRAAYKALRLTVGDLVGFTWFNEKQSPLGLSRSARTIVDTLGDQIGDPRRLENALGIFKSRFKTRTNTYRKVEAEVRAFACHQILQKPASFLPANLADLVGVDVHWTEREAAWARILKATGAPTEPDPSIVAAWSKTTFLSKKPELEERMRLRSPGSPF